MQCNILTVDRWKRFLEGNLSHDESIEIHEHLSTDCPYCEAFFSAMDKGAEQQLLQLLHDGGKAVNVVPNDSTGMVARESKENKENNEGGVINRRWFGVSIPGHFYGPAMTAALLIAIFIGGGLILQNNLQLDEPLQTEKGVAAHAPSIRLEFAAGGFGDNQQLKVDRGELGGRYSPEDMVFLQYEIPAAGYVYIAGYHSRDKIELLSPGQFDQVQGKKAGTHGVPEKGNIKGWPLRDIRGRYNIVGVYSSEPLDHSDRLKDLVLQAVDPATGSVDDHAVQGFGEDMAIDVVYFDVIE